MALLKSLGAPNRPRKLLIQPSANSPFCTSPSQLQEVTLDPDATNFSCIGMRSPSALTSGRSVKEIDELLSSLKKENFNLKLRIYFLEERMGSNFSSGKEDVLKKNIELQIELTNLQKELENKQDLLCQAAKAMEIEEDENKKEICLRDQEILDLKEMLEHIQNELKNEREEIKQMALCAEAFDLNVEESDSLEIIKKLQTTIHDLQEELKKERERCDQLHSIVEVAENVRDKCERLEKQIAEKDDRHVILCTELEETDSKLAEYVKRMDQLEEELLKNTSLLDTTVAISLQKDVQLKDTKLQLQQMQQLYDNLFDERNKFEKKFDKYKWQCCLSEKRNDELTSCVDTLKCKIHNLEIRLTASSMEKRSSMSENIAMRTTSRVHETSSKSISSKVSSPVKKSPKSSHPQSSSAKSVSFKNNDCGESASHALNIDVRLSQEEVVELKKNHFKACKIIKTMIQKKKEYVEQIDHLQKIVNERGEEIKTLQKKIIDGSEHKTTVLVEPKKSIKDKVSELNLSAGWNATAAKEVLISPSNFARSKSGQRSVVKVKSLVLK